jgi:apolipoprotein D and lipocalin family protein
MRINMSNKIICLILLTITSMTTQAQNESEKPLEVVPSVDLVRYAGTWYEIARLPNSFQKKCVSDVTANYTLLDDGQIKVANRCRCEDGTFTEAEGRARRADKNGPNTKLEVRFAPAFLSFLPFVWGKYWIIDLADDYSFAVVGEPNREYLWILGRSSKLDEEQFNKIIERIKIKGYDVSKLIKTKHTQ